MKAYCYILFSPTLNRYYIGFTHESLELRLQKHNSGAYDNSFTSRIHDWELYFSIECATINQALGIEKHIKRMKSRRYTQNLKKYPTMVKQLLARYKSN